MSCSWLTLVAFACGFIACAQPVSACLQAVHALWHKPSQWRPERFLPGGEYEGFKEDIRPFMVHSKHCPSGALCSLMPGHALQRGSLSSGWWQDAPMPGIRNAKQH